MLQYHKVRGVRSRWSKALRKAVECRVKGFGFGLEVLLGFKRFVV